MTIDQEQVLQQFITDANYIATLDIHEDLAFEVDYMSSVAYDMVYEDDFSFLDEVEITLVDFINECMRCVADAVAQTMS